MTECVDWVFWAIHLLWNAGYSESSGFLAFCRSGFGLAVVSVFCLVCMHVGF